MFSNLFQVAVKASVASIVCVAILAVISPYVLIGAPPADRACCAITESVESIKDKVLNKCENLQALK